MQTGHAQFFGPPKITVGAAQNLCRVTEAEAIPHFRST